MFSSLMNDWQALDAAVTSHAVDIESLCDAIARIMGVNANGVGLLRVRGLSLEFVYPFALKSAGRIPLSSSAVAANTATYKKAEIFNNFAKVHHNSVFELVPLGGSAKTNTDPQRIQKLMSAPVVDVNHKVTGVVQISRKARTRDEAGFDFTDEDLQKLDRVSQRIAPIFEKL
jgi:hypothetical protein